MTLGTVIEPRLIARTQSFVPQVVFVTGLPRSGTTLLYQCLVHSYYFSYFSNLAAKLPKCPIAATYLTRILRLQPSAEFSSTYGVTRHWGDPSEGYEILNRWLGGRDEDFLLRKDLSESSAELIRGTISGVARASSRPFLNKNVKHGARLRLLSDLFPESLFIVIRRDRLAVAQSILRGRIDVYGDKNAWFSVKPKAWRTLRSLSYSDQIAQQMFHYEKDIRDEEDTLGKHRVFYVEYDELCETPRSVMQDVGSFLRNNGVQMQDRWETPPSFDRSSSKKVDDDDYNLLKQSLGKVYDQS